MTTPRIEEIEAYPCSYCGRGAYYHKNDITQAHQAGIDEARLSIQQRMSTNRLGYEVVAAYLSEKEENLDVIREKILSALQDHLRRSTTR